VAEPARRPAQLQRLSTGDDAVVALDQLGEPIRRIRRLPVHGTSVMDQRALRISLWTNFRRG